MTALPLAGVTIVDVSRMLPGAVLARSLLDLGARLIKVEDPQTGDLMRHTPPQVGGLGVGFCVHFRGAESVGLDLRTLDGVAALRLLAARADVLIESFRPGTMTRYGLDLAHLRAASPRHVTCSLPGFSDQTSIGHDLNFTAITALLRNVATEGIPSLQIADVTRINTLMRSELFQWRPVCRSDFGFADRSGDRYTGAVFALYRDPSHS